MLADMRTVGVAARLGAGLILGGLLIAAGGPGAAAQDDDTAGERRIQQRVLIGVTGLSWNDFDAEDFLNPAAFAETFVGLLNRTARAASCPADGWLTLGAQVRASEVAPGLLTDMEVPDPAQCGELAEPVDGRLPTWDGYLAAAQGTDWEGHLGTTAAQLKQLGLTYVAVGPGAALALADSAGRVDNYRPAPADLNELQEVVRQAAAEGTDLVVVDAGSRSQDMDVAALLIRAGAAAEGATRAYRDRFEPGWSYDPEVLEPDIWLASIADYGYPALGLCIQRRPGGLPEWRYSIETSRGPAGLLPLPDLMPLLIGYDWRAEYDFNWPLWDRLVAQQTILSQKNLIRYFQDINQHAQAMRRGVQIGYIVVAGLGAVALGLSLVAAAKGWRRRFEGLCLVAGLMPASGFLINAFVPWWRLPAPWPVWGWAGASALLALIILALARELRRVALRPQPVNRVAPQQFGLAGRLGLPPVQPYSPLALPGAIGLLTALTLAVDLFIGQPMTMGAPLGLPILDAKRLYGFGNPAFALFGTGAILAACLFARRSTANGYPRKAAAGVTVVGLIAVAINGWPSLGADFGGAIALVCAFGVLTLLVLEVKLTWLRALGVAALGAAAGVGLATLDYLRGPDHWTHIGAFADKVLHGGAWEILARKAQMWTHLSVPVTALLLVIAAIALVARRRGLRPPGLPALWREEPLARPMGWALVVLWLVGSLINDSGAVVAGVGLMLAGPLLGAAVARQRAPGQPLEVLDRPELDQPAPDYSMLDPNQPDPLAEPTAAPAGPGPAGSLAPAAP
ncbi:MAG: hypothetical protein LBR19_09125 [Bifidobacteriaceae bacterium]|jgi:hypothetical protein|nr:hypothetical protein [Bifidobacteriaceae bacterium]